MGGKNDWQVENRTYLFARIEHAKVLLQNLLSRMENKENILPPNSTDVLPVWAYADSLPALERISRIFNLSPFETMILLLCAGAEVDREVSLLCSKIYKNPDVKFPTFDIAMRAFPNAEWSAILPDSNLRRYHLIEINNHQTTPLLSARIRMPESVLHFLLGFRSVMDNSLSYAVRPVRLTAPIADSHKSHVSTILESYNSSASKSKLPVIHLRGSDAMSNLIIAQRACEELGIGLWVMPGESIPTKTDDQQYLSSILSRECLLSNKAVYLDAMETDNSLKKAITAFAEHSLVPLVFLVTKEPWPQLDKSHIAIEVKRPTKQDQYDIWKYCIEHSQLNEPLKSHYLAEIREIVDRFNMDSVSIESIIGKIFSFHQKAGNEQDSSTHLYSLLQASSYRLTKNKLGDLAEEIIPASTIEDIILPETRKRLIQTISVHFKHRRKVYDEWGFAKKGNRGLGIIALFSGESGTGKTMAAEAIANELKAPLYRIDLSMVSSKFIGETEKNLRQIFDAAEAQESILFFDEADALFGKRSEVKDSHDRYANMQVGYLLQRIESYDGIVILATNFKKSLDPAFMRRIRFIVDFPFPDVESREEIWKKIYPKTVPVDSLDFKFLSRLNITGGSIRNIALNAAFMAAEDGNSVRMDHIKHAAEDEYNKLGRTMSQVETGEWPRQT
jgi:AAA+ superfamily predicted ATPase